MWTDKKEEKWRKLNSERERTVDRWNKKRSSKKILSEILDHVEAGEWWITSATKDVIVNPPISTLHPHVVRRVVGVDVTLHIAYKEPE